MQVLLVSLSNFPVPALVMLLILELSYLGVSVVSYVNKKHLKSFFLLLPKIIQSLLIMIVESCLLLGFIGLENRNFALSPES